MSAGLAAGILVLAYFLGSIPFSFLKRLMAP